LVAVFGGQSGLLHFKKPVFKIIPCLCRVCFFCCAFRWTVLVYFMPAVLVAANGNRFFMLAVLALQTPFGFQFIAAGVLFVAA
jgi:hypothetical protein